MQLQLCLQADSGVDKVIPAWLRERFQLAVRPSNATPVQSPYSSRQEGQAVSPALPHAGTSSNIRAATSAVEPTLSAGLHNEGLFLTCDGISAPLAFAHSEGETLHDSPLDRH